MNWYETQIGVRTGEWVEFGGESALLAGVGDVKGEPNAVMVTYLTEEGEFNEVVEQGRKLEKAEPKPWVGMAGYQPVGTDRYPVEVVEVRASGRKIGVRRMEPVAVEGKGQGPYDDREGEYDFHPRPEADIEWFSWRKKGRRFIRVNTDYSGVVLGQWSYYRDPHV